MTIEEPWTPDHRREAWARQYEIAAALVRENGGEMRDAEAGSLGLCPDDDAATEEGWRETLARIGLDARRIEREVRRVNDLVAGRRVREQGFRSVGQWYDAEEEPQARARALANRTPLIHVTRIRRAA